MAQSIATRTAALIAAIVLAAIVLAVVGTMALSGREVLDRAGGRAGTRTTTLTLAQGNEAPPAQLVQFAEAVAKSSDGALTVKFQNAWHKGDPGGEVETIADVKANVVDLGYVGARAFDRVGIRSFQALLAPMLVDSQELQRKVFEAGIPQAMLGGLKGHGLVGVAVLPGPMRKMLSKGEPFTAPSAFAGKMVGIQESGVATETFKALGAKPTTLPGGGDISTVDGIEGQLSAIRGNHYDDMGGKNVVGNLNLWPRPLVVFTSAATYTHLNDAQRTALKDASAASLEPALDASRAEDTDPVAAMCHSSLRFVDATPQQLTALQKAVAPVYQGISTDAASAARLGQIRRLKSQLQAPADTVNCDGVAPATAQPGALPNGSYWTVMPKKAWRDCGGQIPDRQLLQLVIDDDTAKLFSYDGPTIHGSREIGFSASMSTFRDTLSLTEEQSDPLVFNYTFDGHTLRLSNLRPQPHFQRGDSEYCLHNTVWTSFPWVRK